MNKKDAKIKIEFNTNTYSNGTRTRCPNCGSRSVTRGVDLMLPVKELIKAEKLVITKESGDDYIWVSCV